MCSTMRLIFNLYSTFNALFNIQLRIQHSTIHVIFNSLFTHSIIYSTISRNAIGWRYPTFEQPVPDFDWRRRKTQNPKTFFDSDKPFPNKIWRSTPEHLFTCKIVYAKPNVAIFNIYKCFQFNTFFCYLLTSIQFNPQFSFNSIPNHSI